MQGVWVFLAVRDVWKKVSWRRLELTDSLNKQEHLMDSSGPSNGTSEPCETSSETHRRNFTSTSPTCALAREKHGKNRGCALATVPPVGFWWGNMGKTIPKQRPVKGYPLTGLAKQRLSESFESGTGPPSPL